MKENNASKPYDNCLWDCMYHNGASGCLRRLNDPELKDNFCVGRHVCEIEWVDAGKCVSCVNRKNKNRAVCIYGE